MEIMQYWAQLKPAWHSALFETLPRESDKANELGNVIRCYLCISFLPTQLCSCRRLSRSICLFIIAIIGSGGTHSARFESFG